MTATAIRASHATPEWSSRRWAALSVLLVAGFMDLLDTSVVNVAIPSISRDLHANYAVIQWLIAGYLLAVAVALISGGRLGDLHGRKRVFLLGVAGFGLMSLTAGLAASPGVLVAARVLQGLAAAMMIPQILSVIQVSFPRAEQPKALALYSSVAGVAVMSGPMMAGVFLDVFGWSWRSIFLINVPVSVVVTVAAVAIVPESRSGEARRLDLGGVLLISAALFAVVFALIDGRELHWPPWIFFLMLTAVLLFGAFAGYERRRERARKAPLISMSLFRDRSFSRGLVVVVVFFSGVVGFFLAFTVFLQFGLGFTPLGSALTTFPSSLGLIVAAQLSAKVAKRLGRSMLMVGALLMALAQAALVITIRHFGSQLTAWDVVPVIFVFGMGIGLILPSLADVILAGVHERHAGAASGVINTGMQVGNAAGVAIIGVILFSVIGGHAARSAAAVTPQVTRGLAAEGVPAFARAAVLDRFRLCLVQRLHEQAPAAVPATCRQLDSAMQSARASEVAHVVQSAATTARADDFAVGIQRALLYEVTVFLATAGLLLLLPREQDD